MAIEITLEPTETGGIAGEVDRLHTFPPIWVPPYVEHGKWTRSRNVLSISDIETDVNAFTPSGSAVGGGHKSAGVAEAFTRHLPSASAHWLLDRISGHPRLRPGHPAHSTCRGRLNASLF